MTGPKPIPSKLLTPVQAVRRPDGKYQTDRKLRQAARDYYVERELNQARLEASRKARSIVCVDGFHDRCVGAANCLCECHDE